MNIRYIEDANDIREDMLDGFFEGWKKPLSRSQHLEILRRSAKIVVALDESTGKAAGFVNCFSDGINFAFIPMLEVVPGYRKHGIGTELMRRILSQVEDITCVDLTCDPDMFPFYKRFGMLESHGMVLRKYLTEG